MRSNRAVSYQWRQNLLPPPVSSLFRKLSWRHRSYKWSDEMKWLWNPVRLIPPCMMNTPSLLQLVPRPRAAMLQTSLPAQAQFGYLRPQGRAVAQRLDAGFPPRPPGFAYWQHVGFVVDKAALGQVFSECFGFPCQPFHRFLHYHNHPGLTQ
jgi:hypothetical protein